ncbi:radical SAM protein [Saccharicrinis sp. GN24d3]|uniref:radical SAM protein n=1 Tax=Saccharicrinis sp. GN24d3 TaxID=3458416 RepID=UPI004035C5E0
MNFYTLLNISKKIKSTTLKLIGIYVLHLLDRRHLSVRIDPSLNCNLFCRMCYFSSMEQRKKLKGIIPEIDFSHIAKVLFPRAFQVYVGCGAEPTTHRNFIELVKLAKEYKVPDVGVVTNGQLLTEKQIEYLTDIKLNELTLSCHGVTKESYEHFMTNSKFNRFLNTLELIEKYKNIKKSKYPEIRINYTVNNKNLSELNKFFTVFDKYNINTLQIRPVINIGGKYSHAITDEQIPEYNNIINSLKNECSMRGIRLLANTTNVQFTRKNNNAKVADAVYCYIGPKTTEELNITWKNTNFAEFTRQTAWRKKLYTLILGKKESTLNKSTANYEVFE